MYRLPHPLRKLKLQWRLTLSYMMVTVAAGILLQIALISFVTIALLRAPQISGVVAQSLQRAAPSAASYLERTPPDRAGLDHWLRGNFLRQSSSNSNGIPLSFMMGSSSQLAVVDKNGIVLSSASPRQLPAGSSIFTRVQPDDARVIHAALAGESDPGAMSSNDNGHISAAAPILTHDGQVLGALFIIPDLAAMHRNIFFILSFSLLPATIAWVVFAGLVGLVFGWMSARGLIRRLRVLTHAANAWSGGNFSVTARDSSRDELGQLARDLNRMAEHLQNLLHDRQQLAVVDERNRLARDLHDSVKQQVFATAMQVAAARALIDRDPAAAQQRLEQAEHLVGQAQQELNGLISELRPAALGDKGLAPALRELAAEWSRNSNITAEVRIQGEQRTSLEIEQALFRIAQEALSNVARHSGATSVDIRLAWQGDTLTLAIEDNGRGFEVATRDGAGMGLRSMRERVEALGGVLLVYGLTSGTRIEARVPVQSPPLPPPSASGDHHKRDVPIGGGTQ